MEHKLIEFLIDENGKISISSEICPLKGDPLNCNCNIMAMKLIDELAKQLFLAKLNDGGIATIMNAIAIANTASEEQPYQYKEILWELMTFDFLPKNEKRYRKMKESYGSKVKVEEPLVWVSPLLQDNTGLS